MVVKKSIGETIFDSFNYLFMIFLALMFIYPLYYFFCASISDASRMFGHEGLILAPLGFSTVSYQLLFRDPQIARALINTILYVVFGTALSLLLTTFAAYALSRKKYMLKKAFLLMITIPMFFSGGLIPFYLVVKKLLMLADTPLALLLPTAINSFYVFIMLTYFKTLPESLEESAYIDGANDFTILFKIVIPVSLPVIAVMVIYYAVGQWNSWFNASIFLIHKRLELQPLQLVLKDILVQSTTFLTTGNVMSNLEFEKYKRLIKFALIMVTVGPIIVVYPFMQKYFIQGVMIGSIKE
jgi:putative aldouronate transport system permease protein